MATYTSNYGWTKPSGSDNVDISVLNNNLDDQDSTIHDAFLNMAPPFSESSTYAVDDIVLYGTGLYKCHTAVVTPGSWTGSTNWQVYKLSEGGSGGGGTFNYNDLTNKPSINGVTLLGNKTTSDLGLQDKLTFDNEPTDGSNNPVKSDGVYDSEKDIYAVMGQMGAKNLIPYPYTVNSRTISAVAFTVNDDGTIEANGTASADINFYIHYRGNVQESAPCIIKNGKYIVTGCPSGGGLSTFRIGVGRTYNNAWETLGEDFGTGCYVTLNGDDYSPDNVHLAIVITIKKNAVLSNVVFKPMLRLASDTDDTYQPYAKTNRELTEALTNSTVATVPVTTLGSWITTNIDIDPNTLYSVMYIANNTKIRYQLLVLGKNLHTVETPIGMTGNTGEPNNIFLAKENGTNKLLVYVSSGVGIGTFYVGKLIDLLETV